MTLRSTARDAYHVALDFWGCLRRFVDGKAVNGYDDHMAGLLAEVGRAGQRSGLRVAEALAEQEAQAEVVVCDCGTCTAISEDRKRRSDEADERLADSSPGRPITEINVDWLTGQIQPTLVTAPLTADETIAVRRILDSSAAPGTASPAAAAESPASSDTAASAAADAGHPTSSAAHSLTVDERPGVSSPAPGHPLFTAAELVDAAGAVTRMALLRGVASGNVAYWLALSAKFYDAADAIADASTPPEYTSQLADIGRAAVLETLGNDPASVHDRTLRQRLDEDRSGSV